MGSRQLKKEIGPLLAADDFGPGLAAIRRMPPRQAVSPLFGFFCDLDETVKWHAVTAVGALVADMAAAEPESARIVIRRFIWNLNDESGGIGWGCPEAMGESLARSSAMAAEFWCILTSYIQPHGNFLEHTMLQRGAVWGVGRLGRSQPGILATSGKLLLPYLSAQDDILRATAVWAAENMPARECRPILEKLTSDRLTVRLYDGMKFEDRRISDSAQKALSAIDEQPKALPE